MFRFTKKIFFIIFILILVEIFSYIASKLKLMHFNDTPMIYLKNRSGQLGIEWRNEKNIWGAWHKNLFTQKHISDCFDANYETNSIGARDDEFDFLTTKNVKTWILLGDSMSEGYGVNKKYIFETVVEKEKNLNLFNFSSGGDFGPLQYYLIYKNLAKKYNHNGIIIGYFPQNDLTDNNYYIWKNSGMNLFFNLERYRPYSSKKGEQFNYFIPKNAIPQNDFNYVKNSTKSYFAKILIENTWTSNTIRTFLHLHKRTTNENNKEIKNYQNVNYSSFYDYEKNLLDENIFWIKKIIDESKELEKILIVLPSKNDIKRFLNNKDNSNIFKDIEFALNPEKNKKIKIINPLKQLPNNYEDIFLKCDGHYSAYGHKWIANILNESIE
jgi:hypothetical protein